jgi:hypothetical protein
MTNLRFTAYQDFMANEEDYVELGLFCAEVCDALYQELKGRKPEDLSQSALRAIGLLTV